MYDTSTPHRYFDGEIICFTGKSPKPRKEMTKIANQAGATVSNSITNKVTILVVADPDSTSNKTIKARKLGIKIIGPKMFLELANNETNEIADTRHISRPRKNRLARPPKKQGPPRRRVILDK